MDLDPELVTAREGLIFKGGSGAGLNLSRIRSSKELLSSGGKRLRPGLLQWRGAGRLRRDQSSSGGATPARGQDGRVSTWTTRTCRSSSGPRAREEGQDPGAAGTPAFDNGTSAARTSTSSPVPEPRNKLRPGQRRRSLRAVEGGESFNPGSARDGGPSAPSSTVTPSTAKDPVPPRCPRPPGECADPGHPVRDGEINAWAHESEHRPDHRVEPVLGVHVAGQTPRAKPLASLNLNEVPQPGRHVSTTETFAKVVELVINRDGHLDLLRADFPDRADHQDHPGLTASSASAYAKPRRAWLMATGHAYDSDGGRGPSPPRSRP